MYLPRNAGSLSSDITLANDQLDAQIFNTFITILYMYMFRTISCSSSGRKIVFYVSLTVHFSITSANDQLDAQIFNTFITILYMYMFRTISCSSSGGQIVLIHHLVSSVSVSDRPVHTCTPDGHLQRQLTYIQSDDTRCCINTI